MGNNGKKRKIVLYNKNRFPESKLKQENLCYEAILKRITHHPAKGEENPKTDLEFLIGKSGLKISCNESLRGLHLGQEVNIYAGICGFNLDYVILRATYKRKTTSKESGPEIDFIEYKLDNAIISPISISSFY